MNKPLVLAQPLGAWTHEGTHARRRFHYDGVDGHLYLKSKRGGYRKHRASPDNDMVFPGKGEEAWFPSGSVPASVIDYGPLELRLKPAFIESRVANRPKSFLEYIDSLPYLKKWTMGVLRLSYDEVEGVAENMKNGDVLIYYVSDGSVKDGCAGYAWVIEGKNTRSMAQVHAMGTQTSWTHSEQSTWECWQLSTLSRQCRCTTALHQGGNPSSGVTIKW